MSEETDYAENNCLQVRIRKEQNTELQGRASTKRAPGNPWSGLPIVEAQRVHDGHWRLNSGDGAMQRNDAVNNSEPALGPDDVKAHLRLARAAGQSLTPYSRRSAILRFSVVLRLNGEHIHTRRQSGCSKAFALNTSGLCPQSGTATFGLR